MYCNCYIYTLYLLLNVYSAAQISYMLNVLQLLYITMDPVPLALLPGSSRSLLSLCYGSGYTAPPIILLCAELQLKLTQFN